MSRFGFWPCCQPVIACGDCPAGPAGKTFRFSVSGLIDDVGSNCSSWNGTHDVLIDDTQVGLRGCFGEIEISLQKWVEVIFFTFAGPIIAEVYVTFSDSSRHSGLGRVVDTVYKLTGLSDDCSVESWSLNLDFNGTECSGWSPTIDIAAIP